MTLAWFPLSWVFTINTSLMWLGHFRFWRPRQRSRFFESYPLLLFVVEREAATWEILQPEILSWKSFSVFRRDDWKNSLEWLPPRTRLWTRCHCGAPRRRVLSSHVNKDLSKRSRMEQPLSDHLRTTVTFFWSTDKLHCSNLLSLFCDKNTKQCSGVLFLVPLQWRRDFYTFLLSWTV